jgi:hypothetical protein
VNGGTLNGGAYDGVTFNNGLVNGDTFQGGTINGGTIQGGSFKDLTINGGTITGGTFDNVKFQGGTINGKSPGDKTLKGVNQDPTSKSAVPNAGNSGSAGSQGTAAKKEGSSKGAAGKAPTPSPANFKPNAGNSGSAGSQSAAAKKEDSFKGAVGMAPTPTPTAANPMTAGGKVADNKQKITQAAKQLGATQSEIAALLTVGNIETNDFSSDYAYGDNKSGDAANYGFMKMNGQQIKSAIGRLENRDPTSITNGELDRVNADPGLAVKYGLDSLRYMSNTGQYAGGKGIGSKPNAGNSGSDGAPLGSDGVADYAFEASGKKPFDYLTNNHGGSPGGLSGDANLEALKAYQPFLNQHRGGDAGLQGNFDDGKIMEYQRYFANAFNFFNNPNSPYLSNDERIGDFNVTPT